MSKKNKNINYAFGSDNGNRCAIDYLSCVSKETYLSDDPPYGSFTIENKQPADPIYPTDFCSLLMLIPNMSRW